MSKLEQMMSLNPRATEIGLELEEHVREAARKVQEEDLQFCVIGALIGMICTNAIHRGVTREQFLEELREDTEHVWPMLVEIYGEQTKASRS